MPEEAVPFVSDNIAELITDQLLHRNYDFLVEYGSGDSTRYFLNRLMPTPKSFTHIAVEGTLVWFDKLVRQLREDFQAVFSSEEIRKVHPWEYAKCEKFLRAANASVYSVPRDLSRLEKYRGLFGGPAELKMLIYRLFPSQRPVDGQYSVCLNNRIDFKLILRSTLMKDQFGESPLKADYIDAPLEPMITRLEREQSIRAGFIIDGGPRGDILDRIFDLEDSYPHFHPDTFLCDASRTLYRNSTDRRPSGLFVDGSNRTLSGETLYTKDISGPKAHFVYGVDRISAADLSKNELWYYQSDG